MSVEFGRREGAVGMPNPDYKGPPLPEPNVSKALDPEWTEVLRDAEVQRLGAVIAVMNRMNDDQERLRAVNYIIHRFNLMAH